MKNNSITIVPLNKSDFFTAQTLSKELKLPIKSSSCDYALKIDGDDIYITPYLNSDLKLSPLRADFISKKNKYRHMKISRKNELLSKAVGLKPRIYPHIIDATAGLGVDSFILAALGCHVTMCERSPIMQTLLESGLKRGINDSELKDTIQRMRLIKDDYYHFIKENYDPENNNFDVIYLDPMFPRRSKSAAVKKDMQYMQVLLDEVIDLQKLFESAHEYATYRVIIKRPKNAPLISNANRTYSVSGKAIRFDVYIKKAFPDSLDRITTSRFQSLL